MDRLYLTRLMVGALGFLCIETASAVEADKLAGEKFFETEVRPLLVERCQKCHGEKTQKGQLRLDSLSAALAGGENGQAVVPGKPRESLLIDAIEHNGLEMPPDGKLKPEQIAAVVRWVEMGAPWPSNRTGSDGTDSAEKAPTVHKGAREITEKDRQWWAYRPVQKPELPVVNNNAGVRNEIDRFILAKLQEQGLRPSPEASRETLLRRLTFDLTGLPPTAEEVTAFVNDSDPLAYERVVDRLLESPRYGERWARHWLDLVRYAESDGYKQDDYRSAAWRYRDYVIDSFQNDKPYDVFIQEQLAGDEIAPENPTAQIASGFLMLGSYEYNQRDVPTQWNAILNEITDVTADVFLAQGLACARCHDHKFDALLQVDYYRLRAYFEAFSPQLATPLAPTQERVAYETQFKQWAELTAEIRDEIAQLEKSGREAAYKGAFKKFPTETREIFEKPAAERTPREQQLYDLAYRQVDLELVKLDFSKKLKDEKLARWQELQSKLKEFDAIKPQPLPTGLTASDIGPIAPATFIPGKRNAEPIAPGPLSVIDSQDTIISTPPLDAKTTGRRKALAEWITHPANPLTPRVLVNRLWQYHFGRGLVATSSDFGHLGESPSHPELLDYLTAKFLENGWSIKSLHRFIVNSAAYRQASRAEMASVAVTTDPLNRYVWRQNMRRLDAEQIRDAILSLTGELNLATAGPSAELSSTRRTIFTKVVRNKRDPLFDVFDAPDNLASAPQRSATTTPLQSLLLLNSPWMLDRSKAFATRVQKSASTTAEQVRLAYRLAYACEPTSAELAAATEFITSQATRVGVDDKEAQSRAMLDFCHAILNSSRFLYVD